MSEDEGRPLQIGNIIASRIYTSDTRNVNDNSTTKAADATK